jgi:hypothetical protein
MKENTLDTLKLSIIGLFLSLIGFFSSFFLLFRLLEEGFSFVNFILILLSIPLTSLGLAMSMLLLKIDWKQFKVVQDDSGVPA